MYLFSNDDKHTGSDSKKNKNKKTKTKKQKNKNKKTKKHVLWYESEYEQQQSIFPKFQLIKIILRL